MNNTPGWSHTTPTTPFPAQARAGSDDAETTINVLRHQSPQKRSGLADEQTEPQGEPAV